jgi:hypothetical protein
MPDSAPKVTLSLIALKHTYRMGEPIRVRYELKNVGKTSFYISKGIDPIGNARGCVTLEIYPARRGQVIVENSSLDQSTSYWENRDVREEIRTNWLLLQPGQFYGMEATVNFLYRKPGHYWIAARHGSGYISDKEKTLLTDLDFPLLLGTHAAEPVRIEVLNQAKIKSSRLPK